MKYMRLLLPLLFAGSLLPACNRTTEQAGSGTTGTAPDTAQTIEEMSERREQETKAAIEEQVRTGDTVSIGADTAAAGQ